MCNVKKFEKIYQEIEQLEPEDTLQLMLEADTEEQREFYQMVGDFLKKACTSDLRGNFPNLSVFWWVIFYYRKSRKK